MMHVITRAVPEPGGRLRLTYAGGETIELDLDPMIRRGGVFAPLADPAVFAQVAVGPGGRYVEWPGEVDLCADALWRAAHGERESEAAFFFQFGFSIRAWEELRAALLEHAAEHEVSARESSVFGTRYIVEGSLRTPDGRRPSIRSVWFIGSGQTAPRLVTAYPLQRRH